MVFVDLVLLIENSFFQIQFFSEEHFFLVAVCHNPAKTFFIIYLVNVISSSVHVAASKSLFAVGTAAMSDFSVQPMHFTSSMYSGFLQLKIHWPGWRYIFIQNSPQTQQSQRRSSRADFGFESKIPNVY